MNCHNEFLSLLFSDIERRGAPWLAIQVADLLLKSAADPAGAPAQGAEAQVFLGLRARIRGASAGKRAGRDPCFGLESL